MNQKEEPSYQTRFENLKFQDNMIKDDFIPPNVICPISLGIMNFPVRFSSGQVYDLSSMQGYFNKQNTSTVLCPLTRKPIGRSEILQPVIDQATIEKIEEFFQTLEMQVMGNYFTDVGWYSFDEYLLLDLEVKKMLAKYLSNIKKLIIRTKLFSRDEYIALDASVKDALVKHADDVRYILAEAKPIPFFKYGVKGLISSLEKMGCQLSTRILKQKPEVLKRVVVIDDPSQGKNVIWILAVNKQFELLVQLLKENLISAEELNNLFIEEEASLGYALQDLEDQGSKFLQEEIIKILMEKIDSVDRAISLSDENENLDAEFEQSLTHNRFLLINKE